MTMTATAPPMRRYIPISAVIGFGWVGVVVVPVVEVVVVVVVVVVEGVW